MNMLLLSDFSVIKPDFGLIFWTTLIFALLWWFLSRVAFKPILAALKERESSINDSLKAAAKAREDEQALKVQKEKLMGEIERERARILLEAEQIKKRIIADAEQEANEVRKNRIESAVEDIRNREMEMLTNVKNQTGKMALEVAEKLLRKELQNKSEQEAFANKLINEIKLN